MAISVPERKKLGEILLAHEILTAEQLKGALDGQGVSLLPLASTALTMRMAEESDLASALAEQFGVPGVCISKSTISTDVLGVIPADVAVAHYALPLAFQGNALLLAMANPGEKALIDEIAFASGRAILPHVAPRVVIEQAARSAYEAKSNGDSLWAGESSSHKEPFVEVVESKGQTAQPALADEEEVAELETAPRPTPQATRTDKPLVLAVDDEVEILDIIGKALSHKGHAGRDGGARAGGPREAPGPRSGHRFVRCDAPPRSTGSRSVTKSNSPSSSSTFR